jgi:hypothetical protein
MLISYACGRVIDNIAALPTSAGRVVSTVRAMRQESRRAAQAAAGERCNRRGIQIGQEKLGLNRR